MLTKSRKLTKLSKVRLALVKKLSPQQRQRLKRPLRRPLLMLRLLLTQLPSSKKR